MRERKVKVKKVKRKFIIYMFDENEKFCESCTQMPIVTNLPLPYYMDPGRKGNKL